MNRTFFYVALLFLFLVNAQTAFSQAITPQDLERFKKMEDSLVVAADSMYEAFIPDTRIMYSERFARQLVRTLKIPNSYLYKFDTLQKLINIIYADDNAFRIFNWAVEPGNIPKRYYGAIQLPQPQLKLIGLNDCSAQVEKGLEDSIFTGGRWFGALYYRIMSNKVDGQMVYTLFGLNNGHALSNRKVLDPMYFDGRGVTFGASIFGISSPSNPQKRINRFVLEYKKSVAATMNWDAEKQLIIFDKLTSVTNDPARKYTYVPSGQYDGFIWENSLWNYQQDIVRIKILQDGEMPLE
jgi:hypothetical protein